MKKKILFFGMAMWFFGASFSFAAALKDSDIDGVTDDAEVNRYGTDPSKHDTDGDGFDDGYEIAHDQNPLIPENSSAGIGLESRLLRWWNIFRAEISATLILFVCLISIGVLIRKLFSNVDHIEIREE